MSDHHRRIGRLGGLATAETSEAIRDYNASPEGKEARRRAGVARAEQQTGGGWGESGYLGNLWVASACEKRVAAWLVSLRPMFKVRRYEVEKDGRLTYSVDGEEKQWLPDLVQERSLDDDIYEVKYAPGYPTRLRPEDVVEASPATANNIVEKARAHPQVYIINGASDEMRAIYADLRESGKVREFVPDREGAPDN